MQQSMTVLRRLVAVLLALALLLLLLPVLIAFRVDATLPQADFYVEELRKADIYAFVDEEVLPAAVHEAMKDWEQPLGMQLQEADVVEAVRRVVPRDWLQAQVESSITQVVPYLVGEEDTFRVTVPLQERAEEALEVSRELGHEQIGHIYRYLFATEIPDAVDQRLAQEGGQPFGLTTTGAELSARLQRVVPADWLQERLDEAVDEVGPYVIGREETFQVTVPLEERAAAAVGVVKELLLEADLQSLILDEVIAPEVERSLESSLDLSFGLPGFPAFSVTITSDEVVQVVKEVATEEWLDAQVESVIDGATPYVLGQQEEFQITISLGDRKEAILDAVVGVVATKIGGVLGSLVGAVLGLIPAQVAESIGVPLPDAIVLTQADLRRSMSPGSLELLDEARRVIREGWTYTDADLRQDLADNPDNLDTLEEVREILSQGWTYTEVDLREDLVTGDGGRGAVNALDEVRDNVDLARGLRWLVLLILGLLLAGIGLLDGRSWSGRAGWAAGALAAAALVAYVAAGPVYDSQAAPRLHDALVDARDGRGDWPSVGLLLVNKAIVEVERVAGEFASAVAGRAATLFIVALLVLAGSLAWSRVAPLLRRGSAAT